MCLYDMFFWTYDMSEAASGPIYDDREDITDDKNHKYKVYTSMYTIYIVYINVKH